MAGAGFYGIPASEVLSCSLPPPARRTLCRTANNARIIMGMTSQGQMALRRRTGCPALEARSLVMELQFTRALQLQQWFRSRAAPSRAGLMLVFFSSGPCSRPAIDAV